MQLGWQLCSHLLRAGQICFPGGWAWANLPWSPLKLSGNLGLKPSAFGEKDCGICQGRAPDPLELAGRKVGKGFILVLGLESWTCNFGSDGSRVFLGKIKNSIKMVENCLSPLSTPPPPRALHTFTESRDP